MRTKLIAVLMFALLATAAVAQSNFAVVKGRATDQSGQPIANAQVQLRGEGEYSGQKYELKTNKKGEFYTMGVLSGTYTFKLLKDGKEIYQFNKVQVTLQQPENVVDFDLKKEAGMQDGGASAGTGSAPASGSAAGSATAAPAQAGTAPRGTAASGAATGAAAAVDPNKPVELTEEQKKKLSPEKLKEYEEYRKAFAENQKRKGLNQFIVQAQAADKAGNPEQAVQVITTATQQEPGFPQLWASLGVYQFKVAKKQADRASRAKAYADSAASLKKAVELGQTSTDPQVKHDLPTYQLAYGDSAALGGDLAGAAAAYQSAAQLGAADPKFVSSAYYKLGAAYINAGKAEEAAAAFDKSIQADPSNAEAYYQKGTALVAKVSTDKAGNLVAPPGTEEAFNKYLEMQPTGPNAEGAKAQLQFLNAGKVKTSVKNK